MNFLYVATILTALAIPVGCKSTNPVDVEPEPAVSAEAELHNKIRSNTQGVWMIQNDGVPAFCIVTPNDQTCSTMSPKILEHVVNCVGI